MTKQKTILREVSLQGRGLHTGKENITVTFKPAPEDSGYIFKRIDLEGIPEINAVADLVRETARGTTLIKGDLRIATVEHCLASIFALNIDNIYIEIDAEEMPIMDGSAKYFVEALESAGLQEQEADRKEYVITEPISYSDPNTGSEFIVVPDEALRYSIMIDYNTEVLGTQNAILFDLADFKKEISSSRTFVFIDEMEPLIKHNLIKGGDLNNAIVFVNKILPQEDIARLKIFFNRPDVEVKKEGILNNCELSFPNEPARHKLLDVIGDLALVGMRFTGHVIARKPGHAANVAFALKIRKYIQAQDKLSKIPKVDANTPALFDIVDITKKLPHRPPFLLIDKILELSETHVVGVKNVTMNEPFFVGHFPDRPVMPGVLQIEAMAQCGGILALSTVPDPENYITYFVKIDNVRFRAKVVPGDILAFRLELLTPVRRGLFHMGGKGYVGNQLVVEAELMAQIVKEKE
ncbi:MAG: bifunctional UDP-3-O-[3-hydroxymyristoyl] N-acetylglucosamine deacetylase/3-hydroxyacyl-ACP dehydratase [Bacteroidales bacterium]|jgi:UDP-3-O-[3-hydroxymyristoyl] N-acetylglucosamine deacetylase/3-hydroxyacyl-[acyl-carrier-protein] dehydratase|nr:bifunctional UDP-3-O-[3-hydroxymyristoyl] N-acetylglucosamine deacetylase/3-hydroxyacyl-ACP dehydratase [Bacteroidales bacterium]